MQLSLIDEADVSPALDAEIRAALCVCFPADVEIYRHTRAWHGAVAAYTYTLRDGQRLVAHASAVDRTITVGGRPVRVAGVENVFVVPDCRGQRLSRHVLLPAMEEAARRGFDCGLLFCLPILAKVYAECGWQLLEPRAIVRVEDGAELPLPAKNIAMFHPLRVTQFPDGPVHLGGNDW
jgi:GNAT superfamily N-acetyltransferase